MKLKALFKSALVAVAFLSIASVAGAAPGGPGGMPGGGPRDPDPNSGAAVPLDAGLTAMVAAGIAYAAKRKHDKKKQEGAMDEGAK